MQIGIFRIKYELTDVTMNQKEQFTACLLSFSIEQAIHELKETVESKTRKVTNIEEKTSLFHDQVHKVCSDIGLNIARKYHDEMTDIISKEQEEAKLDRKMQFTTNIVAPEHQKYLNNLEIK